MPEKPGAGLETCTLQQPPALVQPYVLVIFDGKSGAFGVQSLTHGGIRPPVQCGKISCSKGFGNVRYIRKPHMIVLPKNSRCLFLSLYHIYGGLVNVWKKGTGIFLPQTEKK